MRPARYPVHRALYHRMSKCSPQSSPKKRGCVAHSPKSARKRQHDLSRAAGAHSPPVHSDHCLHASRATRFSPPIRRAPEQSSPSPISPGVRAPPFASTHGWHSPLTPVPWQWRRRKGCRGSLCASELDALAPGFASASLCSDGAAPLQVPSGLCANRTSPLHPHR